MTEVILVDVNDRQTGLMEKMEAHQKAVLHRAFSIFIFNSKGEMLLQQRALNKYHSGGLWTNACCSHPLPGETVLEAANRRLQEELGFSTELKKAFDFIYTASLDNGLSEHEFDHVFTGHHNTGLNVNPEEVNDYCYMTMEAINDSLKSHPAKYTEWFKIAFPKLEEYLASNTTG